jgi:L-rhamnose-H+ transport protein
VAISVFAGVLSCLPNVGMAFGGNVINSAQALGVSQTSSGNTVWALFFTLGFVANLGCCVYLMIAKGTVGQYWNHETPRNLRLSALMALMWIGSFYLYGAGATRLGRWGAVVGWPLFISLSIVVGNLWGLSRGEWKSAPAGAKRLLNMGMLVLLVAVITVAISNSF